jgi:capsular exopolysaccharide synthesis family protein
MTLIENAISRSRAQRAAEDKVAHRTPEDSAAHRTPEVGAPERLTPLHFQTATLDPVLLERHCVLPQVADRAVLRAYKILRTRLLQRLAANRWRSFAVTSTKPGEGKTLTTINLAVALSQDPNTRVCLVDFDLQRPQIAAQLGIKCERGIGDYLLGEAEAEQVIYDCGLPRLLVIPNSRIFDHSSEMLASVRTHELLRMIDTQMPDHIVLFDMPPLTSDDVLTFAPRVDGVLLVVAERRTERASLEKSKQLLAEMNILGVVLNRSAERDDELAYY